MFSNFSTDLHRLLIRARCLEIILDSCEPVLPDTGKNWQHPIATGPTQPQGGSGLGRWVTDRRLRGLRAEAAIDVTQTVHCLEGTQEIIR